MRFVFNRVCLVCRQPIFGRSDKVYCSNACRQRAYRFRLLCSNPVSLSAWRQLSILSFEGRVTDSLQGLLPSNSNTRVVNT